MSGYKIFLFIFLLSVVAAIFFLIFYLQAVFGIALQGDEFTRHNRDAFEIFARIFSPQVILSFFVMAACSLAYRIQGIVLVVRNKSVGDGEKALWIFGFILMGFVTAIVFLVLAKSRQFTA